MVTIVTSGVACSGCDGMCDNIVSQQSTNECAYLSPTGDTFWMHVPVSAVRWNANLTGLALFLAVHEEKNNHLHSRESLAGVSIPHQTARMTPYQTVRSGHIWQVQMYICTHVPMGAGLVQVATWPLTRWQQLHQGTYLTWASEVHDVRRTVFMWMSDICSRYTWQPRGTVVVAFAL